MWPAQPIVAVTLPFALVLLLAHRRRRTVPAATKSCYVDTTAAAAATDATATSAATAAAAAAAVAAAKAAAADVSIIARFDNLTFIHKPACLGMHPGGKRKPKISAGELLCPACGRSFGKDSNYAWRRMHDHLIHSKDAIHTSWHDAHPEGFKRELEEEQVTLWHVLRGWPAETLFDEPPPPPEGEEGITIHFCNRLDQGTSGIVVLAASAGLADAVQREWSEETTRKTYLVMARGTTAASFVVDRPLTDRSTREPTQRSAVTAFELVRTCDAGELSLLRAELVEGGRHHQIRRHLNSVAHQVVGDSKHGKSYINFLLQTQFGLQRMFLHAERLRLRHPRSGEMLDVFDPLPADLEAFLARLPP